MTMDTVSKAVPIPQGALFTITTGEYSDYTVHGVFRALKEIDMDALRKQWLRNHPEQKEMHTFDEHQFLAAMTRRGLFKPVKSWNWHLGDYGNIDRMRTRGP